MENWLNESIEITYRELFQLLTEHGESVVTSDVDVETISFDKIMTLFQDMHNGELPYTVPTES